MGGVASAILEFLNFEAIKNIDLVTFEYDDAFITHGKTEDVEKSLELDNEHLAQRVIENLKEQA
jgi:1-deoxy-D-xylulose-5-phosphate synthase